MLENFDFSILDNEDFKEDSVREEIISPILHAIGYLPYGEKKIVRSKKLTHPFVYIGSIKRKVSIVPDYTLYYQSTPLLVLDAKHPRQKIINSHHVEQVFSYAIHPEIRCYYYALCNGKEISLFHISETSPIIVINIEDNRNNLSEFTKYFAPDYLLMPEKREFLKDYGVFCKNAGISPNHKLTFCGYYLQSITMIEFEKYSAEATSTTVDDNYIVSFDFSKQEYQSLLSFLPKNVAEYIEESLSRQPYRCEIDCKVIIDCEGVLGELQKSSLTLEEFIPITLSKIITAIFDKDSSCIETE